MPLIRLSLVVAILAGAGALFFGHTKVQEKINTITTERDEATKKAEEQTAAATKSKAEAKKFKEDMDAANKELATTKGTLETTTARLGEQEKRANQVSEDLTKMTAERNDVQRELVAWQGIGFPVDQIRLRLAEIGKVKEERDAFVGENKILLRKIGGLEARLAKYEDNDSDKEVRLPAGLKGKVVAVDPKFDFVVLDIGGSQGVVENSKLLINRAGKLVAKVKVTKVEANRSFANVLSDYRFDDVVEGDQVLY